jgi:hypothetical protein
MTIVDDHRLLGLIERLERTRAALDRVEPIEFYAVAASTVRTLHAVTDFLVELREDRLTGTK